MRPKGGPKVCFVHRHQVAPLMEMKTEKKLWLHAVSLFMFSYEFFNQALEGFYGQFLSLFGVEEHRVTHTQMKKRDHNKKKKESLGQYCDLCWLRPMRWRRWTCQCSLDGSRGFPAPVSSMWHTHRDRLTHRHTHGLNSHAHTQRNIHAHAAEEKYRHSISDPVVHTCACFSTTEVSSLLRDELRLLLI